MGTQGPLPYSRLCVRRIIVDVTTSEIGNEPKMNKPQGDNRFTDKIVYADVNQTSASKRTVHERFWAELSPLSTNDGVDGEAPDHP